MSGIIDIRQLMIMKNQLSNVVTRTVVQTIRQDGGKIFVQVTGRKNQVRDGVEHLCQYGFRSMPNPGSRGVGLAVGGVINNSSVVVVDDKRFGRDPVMVAGEARQYDDQGAFHRIFDMMQISFADSYEWSVPSGDKVEFMDGEFKITIGSTTFEFTSSGLQVTGGDVIADTVSLQNHVHLINGGSSAPGPTAAPTP